MLVHAYDSSDKMQGSFRVFLGKKLAMDWYIAEVPNDVTVASVMDIQEASQSAAGLSTRFVHSMPKDIPLPRYKVAKSSSMQGMEVTLGLIVRKMIAQFGEYVMFTVPSTDEESSSMTEAHHPQQTNAFALLAAGAQAAAAPAHLPEAKGQVAGGKGGRGDWRLFNKV